VGPELRNLLERKQQLMKRLASSSLPPGR
jgi:hypothetical protein